MLCAAVCLLALQPIVALAQTAASGTITGRVINNATSSYLSNAEVRIVGTDRVTITESDGSYEFNNVPAGSVTVSTYYTGLDSQEQKVVVTAGGTTKADFNLVSAQESGGDVVKLAAFKVSGPREGNAKAIVDQRQAYNIKTVIASDAFGDVAEGNIGEFLRFLPGITVDFVEADIRAVRVRGLPPKYATTTFDGLPVANSGSSDITRTRALEFEQVSLATVETVEVNKSPTADMASAGLGGNINAVGKRAFTQKGRHIKYSAGTLFNQYQRTLSKSAGWDNKNRSKIFPGGSLEYTDTLLDGKLGVVAAVNHSGSYMQQKILNNGFGFNADLTDDATELPIYNSIQARDGPKPTWRDSAVLNLDYKVSQDLVFTLLTSYGGYEAEFYNKDFTFVTNAASVATTTTAGNRTDRTQVSQLTMTTTSGTGATSIGNTASNARVASSNSNKTGSTYVVSPSFDFKHDILSIHGGFSYSQSKNDYYAGEKNFFRAINTQMNGVSWMYQLEGDTGFKIKQLQNAGSVGITDTRSVFDLRNYTGAASVTQEGRHTKAQTWSGRLDAELNFANWKYPTKIKIGGSGRMDVLDLLNPTITWTVTTGPATTATTVNFGDFADTFPATVGKGVTFTDIKNVTTVVNPTIDNFKLYQLFRTYVSDLTGLSANAGPFVASRIANLNSRLKTEYDVKEQIKAAYGMSTTKLTDKLTAVAGLRFEQTETTGKSFDDIGINRTLTGLGITATTSVSTTGVINSFYSGSVEGVTMTNATAGAAANTSTGFGSTFAYQYKRYGGRISRSRDYNNLLPSFQLRYEPKRNLVTRFAYFKSLLRPDHGSVVGGLSVNDADVDGTYVITRNNLDLKAETANNYDITAEYYFEPVGVISFGVFYKDIKNIQIQLTSPIDPNNIPEDIQDIGLTATQLGSTSTVAQRVNGANTSVQGAELNYSQELSFLPGAFRGFGVSANLTYVKPKDETLFLQSVGNDGGISKWSGNLVLRYRFKKFNTQLSANWVDTTARGITSNRLDYQKSRIVYGVNVNYNLHRYATLFLNIANLTNEPQSRYTVRPLNTLRDGDYGATYNIGIKGSF